MDVLEDAKSDQIVFLHRIHVLMLHKYIKFILFNCKMGEGPLKEYGHGTDVRQAKMFLSNRV